MKYLYLLYQPSGSLKNIEDGISVEDTYGNKNRSLSSSAPLLIIPRDAHKAVFDSLTLLQNVGAILLPSAIDPEFGVSLGVDTGHIAEALSAHPNQVNHILSSVRQIWSIVQRLMYTHVFIPSDVLVRFSTHCHGMVNMGG